MAKNMLGVIFLGLLVAYDAFAAVDGVVSGDVRCVVLQRRSGIDESGPGELGTHYTGAGFLRGFSAGEVLGGKLELRGFINVRAMRQRRRERQWHREDLQTFEENLRLPIGAEEEDFDFLGIRWMQDGRYSGDDGLMRESHQKLLPRIVDLHQALPFPPRRKHKIHCGLATVEILTAA
ncbi:hypothetical protein PV328_004323 [Microctonus aethiopoides]|uniref:Uncharacterized protein n=1 Tax=Microctonus aethiopoides TaxID=144406 RepID=A0AA39FAA2_9HYME|nr:hypothetical protein PV328_004323 [Microctonus aethiopoides]